MSRKIKPNSTDPRRAGGDISGPGGPFDQNAVILSVDHAVLLDHCTVAAVADQHDEEMLAMQLEGRINKTEERARIMYLFDADGAAAIITELYGLAARIGPDFFAKLQERIAAMPRKP